MNDGRASACSKKQESIFIKQKESYSCSVGKLGQVLWKLYLMKLQKFEGGYYLFFNKRKRYSP